jgi:hypothetical protein
MESRDDLISMLYYLGFLTIQDNVRGESRLGIPNRTIENLYARLYLNYMNKRLVPSFAPLNAAVNGLIMDGDYEPFREFLEQNLSLLMPNDFDKMNEQGIKNFVVAYLRLYQNIHLETELNVEGGGRIDVAILPTPLYTFSHYYVMELKYIKKKDDTPSARDTKRKEAIDQLERYRSSQRVAEAEKLVPIHKLIVLTVKDKVFIEELGS